MTTTIEKALFYSATARRALRDAIKHKLHYRYPECISNIQSSIEFAGKSMLEFKGIKYEREHYVGENLEAIGKKMPNLKEKVARAIVLSDRWLHQSRNLTKYGFQSLGLSPKVAFSKYDTDFALSNAQEMLKLLNIVEMSEKLQFPIKLAILDGYASEDRVDETPCKDSPFTSLSAANWKEYFSKLQANNKTKYEIEFISTTQINNQYAIVINPFGEVYPEIDIENKVVFNIIDDYISNGGVLVCAGGFPMFYAWNVKKYEKPIPMVVGEIHSPLKITIKDGGAIYVEEWKKLLPFSGTLLWSKFSAQTTSDNDKHSGPYSLEVTQNQDDIDKFGRLTDLGGKTKVSEFRSLTRETKECIPLLRANRPDFGEVYPVAAISHGSGYLFTCGMAISEDSEKQKTLTAVDRFIDWLLKVQMK